MSASGPYRYCPYDGRPLVRSRPGLKALPACSQCGFVDYRNATACVAVFILRNRHVLLARRAVAPAKGAWDTVGGFIEENESAEQAAARETFEETGLKVTGMDYLGSVPDVYAPHGKPVLHLCYLANVADGEPTPMSDVAALVWFPVGQWPEPMAFGNQAAAFRLLEAGLACAARSGLGRNRSASRWHPKARDEHRPPGST